MFDLITITEFVANLGDVTAVMGGILGTLGIVAFMGLAITLARRAGFRPRLR